MKVYLITTDCEDGGVYVHAVETDETKARRLYEIFPDDDKDVCFEEYSTDDYADMLAGKIPYRVRFVSGRDPEIRLAGWQRVKFPSVEEHRGQIYVYVHAASKDEAYQNAVVIHRDYVTEKYFK